MDSTIVKVHPDGTGALKKRTPVHRQVPWLDHGKIHMVAADARTAVTFCRLCPRITPEGRKLLERLGLQDQNPFLLMDRAYEGNETRQLALTLGFTPVVPAAPGVGPWPTTGRCTSGGTKSSGCFAGIIRRAFDALALQARHPVCMSSMQVNRPFGRKPHCWALIG